jgi:hypothetical protein
MRCITCIAAWLQESLLGSPNQQGWPW